MFFHKISTIIVGVVLSVNTTTCNDNSPKNTEEKKSTEQTMSTDTTIKNVVIDPNFDVSNTGAVYKIDSVYLIGDILHINVNYSGGCENHSFELFSTGLYMKSMPPQISVYLKHTNNNDACRKLVMQELQFNISSLKYKGTENTIILLGDKQINYFN